MVADRWRFLAAIGAVLLLLCCSGESSEVHVHEGESIQDALDALASSGLEEKRLVVHAGVYRPDQKQMAFIWLNRRHDGIVLEARGKVVLTAANPEIGSESDMGYPAIVNHVVYVGDGVTDRTIIRGFEITGANGFETANREFEIEPNRELKRQFIYYGDGGGIKVFGNSYPRIENLRVHDNMARFCGGGISIEQTGRADGPVVIENSVFEGNRVALTGAAIDLLPGSKAVLNNVLVRDNHASQDIPLNTDFHPELKGVSQEAFTSKFENSSALTVFITSRLEVANSSFVENGNALDQVSFVRWYRAAKKGMASNVEIRNSLFIGNEQSGSQDAYTVKVPYNLDIRDSFINDEDPDFDAHYEPMNPRFAEAGYRPARAPQ